MRCFRVLCPLFQMHHTLLHANKQMLVQRINKCTPMLMHAISHGQKATN